MVCWKKQSTFLYYNCVHSDKVEVTVKDGFIGNADKIFQAKPEWPSIKLSVQVA